MYLYVHAMYPRQDTPTTLYWSTAWISASAAVLTWEIFLFLSVLGIVVRSETSHYPNTTWSTRWSATCVHPMRVVESTNSEQTPMMFGQHFLAFLSAHRFDGTSFFRPKPQRQNPSQIVISWLAGLLDRDEKFTNLRRIYMAHHY